MYHNAIVLKSLPRVADMSRKKSAIDDTYGEDAIMRIISARPTEEESLRSLNKAVKKLHYRLKHSSNNRYTPSLEVLISLQ